MKYQEIINRLKKACGILTDIDLAKLLGLSRQDFHVQKKRDKIPFEKIILLCKEKGFSLEYIFHGEESETEKEIIQLQNELIIEKRLVSEIKDLMKELVGKA
jgi:hypothetical protein